jgi:hypothetical protein
LDEEKVPGASVVEAPFCAEDGQKRTDEGDDDAVDNETCAKEIKNDGGWGVGYANWDLRF